MKATIELEIDLESIFVTAIEGGSNHWFDVSETTYETLKTKYPDVPFSIRVYRNFCDGNFLEVIDAEEPTEKIGLLCKSIAMKNLSKFMQYANISMHNIVNGYCDAEEADVVFQYMILGEIVYG